MLQKLIWLVLDRNLICPQKFVQFASDHLPGAKNGKIAGMK